MVVLMMKVVQWLSMHVWVGDAGSISIYMLTITFPLLLVFAN